MKMRLPRYVHAYVDVRGKARHYFRRPQFKSVPLPGWPWSPEFMTAYEHAMAGQPLPIGADRAKPGSMRALAVSFFASHAFRSLSTSTQRAQRAIIDRLCEQHGDLGSGTLRREHVVKLMAARPTAESSNKLRKALRAMMRHAVDVGIREDDPTRDVRAMPIKTSGYHAWTEEEIAQFEARHPVGTRARLALALLLGTGQRRGDVVRMGRQHIRDGMLSVRQQKTGAEMSIPIMPELAAAIAGTTSGQMTFLMTQYGRPFTAAGFGVWLRERCDEAGLPQCSAHGLRKAAARRLAEAGCTAHEIASITGHASLREIVRYTKSADQKRLAITAMRKVETRTEVVNLDHPLSRWERKS